jgi:hypothetical protein
MLPGALQEVAASALLTVLRGALLDPAAAADIMSVGVTAPVTSLVLPANPAASTAAAAVGL